MTDVEMLKSLTRTLEILAEENKELRNEIKQLKGITCVLSDKSIGLTTNTTHS